MHMLAHALLAQSYYNYTYSAPTTSAAIASFFLIFIFLFYAIAIAYAIFHLIAIYNWGTSDSKYFDAKEESKKTWFWIITFVPFGSIYYFFAVRPHVNMRKKADMQPIQTQQQPEQQPQS